jgi:hypothetical protein
MAKKRKTRQEKIILQLKRQLQKKETKTPPEPKENQISQEAISIQPQVEPIQVQKEKKTDNSVFSTDLKLIRKDLFKTLILTFIIISFEMVLYLYLR